MIYENYLTPDFHTNIVISACLPTRQNGVENRDRAYLYLAWRIQGPTNLDKIKEKMSPLSSPLNQSVRIRVQSKTCHVSITEKEKKGGEKGWLSKIVAINMFVETRNACQTKTPKSRH